MERLNESLRAAAIILDTLRRGGKRWTPLVRAGYRRSTPWRVHSIIYWLVDHGAIEHVDRGKYTITAEGRALLEALQGLKTEKWLPEK